jgi:archaellum component FlaF (FlaF/FlaG flagellin family)
MGKSLFFNGSIDESRISTGIRSAAWMNTSFKNQNSSSSFISVGNQEDAEQLYRLNITIKNSGSITLQSKNFIILINGTSAPCTYSTSYLHPTKSEYFETVNFYAISEKRVKVIADNSISDYYVYNS